MLRLHNTLFFFFFNDTATTEIYTLSLHDALPIYGKKKELDFRVSTVPTLYGEKVVMRLLDKENLRLDMTKLGFEPDRKSTRLNSSHSQISYAVFCLKKKNVDAVAKDVNVASNS